MGEHKIGLGEVIEQLRAELQPLIATANDKDLRFAVENVEIELHVGVTKEGTTGAKATFWVLELGAEGKYAHERTQTVKLTLKPRVEGAPSGTEAQVSRGATESRGER